MSRLELLQMKRVCASYGPGLTPYEQIELYRLESERDDQRYGRIGGDSGADAESSAAKPHQR